MNNTLICPCGAICSECEKYPTECAGCHAIKGKVWWTEFTGEVVCPFYSCANEKKIPHCGKCGSFPCEKFIIGDPTKSDEENRIVLQKQIKNLTGK